MDRAEVAKWALELSEEHGLYSMPAICMACFCLVDGGFEADAGAQHCPECDQERAWPVAWLVLTGGREPAKV